MSIWMWLQLGNEWVSYFRGSHLVLSPKETVALGWTQLQVEMFSGSDCSICFLSNTSSSDQ